MTPKCQTPEERRQWYCCNNIEKLTFKKTLTNTKMIYSWHRIPEAQLETFMGFISMICTYKFGVVTLLVKTVCNINSLDNLLTSTAEIASNSQSWKYRKVIPETIKGTLNSENLSLLLSEWGKNMWGLAMKFKTPTVSAKLTSLCCSPSAWVQTCEFYWNKPRNLAKLSTTHGTASASPGCLTRGSYCRWGHWRPCCGRLWRSSPLWRHPPESRSGCCKRSTFATKMSGDRKNKMHAKIKKYMCIIENVVTCLYV